ncbi:hypothetical protein CLOSTHATH_06866, partial [Hungatella hathewayi DSM 13479]
MKKKKRNHIIWIVCMTVVSAIILLPIIVMILTSFKTTGEINSAVFHFLPDSLNFDNYKTAMSTGNWLIYFRNSNPF